MEKVAKLNDKDRSDLFRVTAEKMGVTEAIIEKDFWACLLLKTIFENNELSEVILFKGGTSLSKCYNLIHRFSEDIDLILDWRALGITDDEAWQVRSGTKQNKFNMEVDKKGRKYIETSIVPLLDELLKLKIGNLLHLEVDETDGHVVKVHYPTTFTDPYLLDHVKLEIGPRASRIPQSKVTISSYAGEAYPDLFANQAFTVKVIMSERTFWEKATILHHVASVGGGKALPRYSRHYYDLFQMIHEPVKDRALADMDLLKQVVKFKSTFYRSAGARYDLAKPGSFKLIPSDDKCRALKEDYSKMKEMIYGNIPEFDEIMAALELLEQEINS